MSQFLGRQGCIKSLRNDLVDLQGTTLDVFSRTGPVRVPSWKFPDKLSCNLDMVALLEQYDFVDGEDAFNQLSHIVLLELVIDRLLLLLQSFDAYVDQTSRKKEQAQQRRCLSVGLIVRNYWTNLVHLANVKSMPPSHLPSSLTQSTPRHAKVDSLNASCQTIQSSLVPCNACDQVQSTLRKNGDALVELFQSEGLPSSLQPFLVAVEDTLEQGQMTAGDVAQWGNEQLRDMRRLAKHLQDVRGTVQPLQKSLEAAETERERLRSQLERTRKELKQTTEKQQASIVQLEFSLRRAQRSTRDTEQRLLEEQQQLKREHLCLEESNARLREKVAAQQDALQAIEHEKNVLQERVRALHAEEEACRRLQQRIQKLEAEISETQLGLDKENAKYRSACRQQESMHAKQQSLLQRVDALDEECEELRRQLGEREEKEMELQNQRQRVSEEKEQLQARLAEQQGLCLELQRETMTLEAHVGELKSSVTELQEYVQTLKERERQLVAFPELCPQAQPWSTGNVLLDMEQQAQANSIRIKVLEQENTTLHTSLVKLKERAQNDASREASLQQTWSLSLPSTPEKQQNQPALLQKSPRQSSSAVQRGYSNTGEEDAGRGESGVGSVGSGDLMPTTAASPSPRPLHIQTLQLSSTAATRHTKTGSGCRLARSKRNK